MAKRNGANGKPNGHTNLPPVVGVLPVPFNTATKTLRKSLPPHLTPGNPGNSGGKAGRSGRKPEAFLDMCRVAALDPTLWAEAREKNPVAVLALSAEYSEPKPAQQHKVDATVVFKAVRE